MTVAATLLDSRYLLDEEIGAGGAGEVWRATDCVLTRPVAVKLLHTAYARQPEALARFKAEARHAGALSHDNIARVYDYGEPEPGQSYLVMELIEGPSLDTALAGGPLDAARTMDIVAQVAAGLQGIVAYECLAGTRPFTGPPLEVMIAHRDLPLPPLPGWVPAELAAFVMTLTAKDPGWRPRNADEVAGRARSLRDELVSGAIRPQRAPAGPPLNIAAVRGSEGRRTIPSLTRADRPRRPRLLAAAVVALAVLACLTLLTAAVMASTAHPATHQAAPPPPVAPTVPASASPVPTETRPAGQRPSASSGASTRELAASGQPPALQPGAPGHKHPPGQGTAKRGKGHGEGNGPGHGHGPH